jgi:hypothetical protein
MHTRHRIALAALCLALASCGKPSGPAADESAPEAPTLASQLDADLRRVRTEVEKLASSTADLYTRKQETLASVDRSKYAFAPNGSFHKPVNDGSAAVWISGAVPITAEVRDVAYLTEPLDRQLIGITRDFPEVNQAYYNDRNSLNRIYPWFDAVSQYPPKMNIPEFNFYYLADEKHNPGRGGVWVDDPYVDPAGRGWMVSAIAPVYHEGALVGVAGLDVTIATIMDRYFKARDVPLLVLAGNGVVVAATEKAVELLEMPPLKDHKYLETVKGDTFKPDEYNVLKSRERGVRDMASSILEKSEAAVAVDLAGKTYTAVSVPVRETGWKVVEFVAR